MIDLIKHEVREAQRKNLGVTEYVLFINQESIDILLSKGYVFSTLGRANLNVLQIKVVGILIHLLESNAHFGLIPYKKMAEEDRIDIYNKVKDQLQLDGN